MSDQLRKSVGYVIRGEAKMSETYYGDDGIDMARDIQAVLVERDRYRAALDRIAAGDTTDSLLTDAQMVIIAEDALKGSE